MTLPQPATRYELHPQLADDTAPVCDLSVCEVRLMDDANHPWLVLVPKLAGAVEIIDLTPAQRTALSADIDRQRVALTADIDAMGAAVRSELHDQGVALRSEIHTLGTELRSEIHTLGTELRSEMGELRGGLLSEMGELRSELRGEMSEMRGEMRAMSGDVRAEMYREQRNHTLAMIGANTAIAALVVAALQIL